MKNIHVLTTPNPSKLWFDNDAKQFIYGINSVDGIYNCKNQNICITNNEKPKIGDWVYDETSEELVYKIDTIPVAKDYPWKKIILTTDQDLIKDGVQSIPDEFLEWFVKNPSCEEVKVESINIGDGKLGYIICKPKEEPNYNMKQEILAEMERLEEEPKQETFNSNRGLKEVQLKDPNTCENYKEVGCVKDVCDCYTLVSKEEPSTRLKNSLKQFNISLEEALGMEDFRLKNIGFSKRSILEIDLFRGEPKQETLEKYYLSSIKNVLQFGNDAQAIRLMENYYHAKKQQDGK